MIVDDGTELKKVQVKTTRYKDGRYYQVDLRVKGGNQSFHTSKSFDNSKVDALFVVADSEEMWYIPSSDVKVSAMINPGEKYESYKVSSPSVA